MTQKEILNDRVEKTRKMLEILAVTHDYLDGMIRGYISLAIGLGIIDLDEYIERCEEQDRFMEDLRNARK